MALRALLLAALFDWSLNLVVVGLSTPVLGGQVSTSVLLDDALDVAHALELLLLEKAQLLVLDVAGELALEEAGLILALEAGVEVGEMELSDGLGNECGVGDVHLLVASLEADGLEAAQDVHGHLVDLLGELLEHGRMEEEPDAVGEEEVGLRGADQHVEEVLRRLHVPLQEEGAQLGDVELQVVAEHAVEVGVHAALLEVPHCARLVRVHAHHGLDHLERLAAGAELLVDVEPLLETLHEGLLGHGLALLAADAAAEEVVEAAARAEEAARLRVVVLHRHDVVQHLLPSCLVVLVRRQTQTRVRLPPLQHPARDVPHQGHRHR
mmetsp:Transcript_11423/g.19296  ORF Transcript_11423/g.19296 Transcript_11423/m.19296 type:complete len:324 (+) Transcript_11423:2480-3451(+)